MWKTIGYPLGSDLCQFNEIYREYFRKVQEKVQG